MNVQIINKNGRPEWAIIPYDEYIRLKEEAEMLQDVADFDAAKEALEQGEELIPSEVTFAILDGENPIRIWRNFRALTQQELADKAGISKPYLSQIETGKRTGTAEVLAAIADALGVTVDDVMPVEIREG
ncbi:MAG: XRE family transcriptional regulator [Chloroflexi bacterium RBG_16_48_8]|nr:MAG: XRE family transcriptional regulator [Chloroflexi bacterium RBG_16_48_8]